MSRVLFVKGNKHFQNLCFPLLVGALCGRNEEKCKVFILISKIYYKLIHRISALKEYSSSSSTGVTTHCGF
jgi:hypothetical protein